MKKSSPPCLVVVTVLVAAMLAAAAQPAWATTRSEFEAARGRYELSDGRAMDLGGSARRPSVVLGDGEALPLETRRDGTLASADGRLDLRFVVQPNGPVTIVRVTQRLSGRQRP